MLIDAELAEILRKLADRLDVKLNDTEIVDKNGTVHDLAELAKSACVISTGVSHIMSLDDYCAYSGPRWVTYDGQFYNHSEDLAKAIREHADDPDVEITVHKF